MSGDSPETPDEAWQVLGRTTEGSPVRIAPLGTRPPRFVATFEGPDWFEMPDRPGCRFLAPAGPTVDLPDIAEWPEGWEAAGYITDEDVLPPGFRREDPR